MQKIPYFYLQCKLRNRQWPCYYACPKECLLWLNRFGLFDPFLFILIAPLGVICLSCNQVRSVLGLIIFHCLHHPLQFTMRGWLLIDFLINLTRFLPITFKLCFLETLYHNTIFLRKTWLSLERRKKCPWLQNFFGIAPFHEDVWFANFPPFGGRLDRKKT